MKTVVCLLAVCLLSVPALAQEAPIVLIVDAGPLHLNADALARDIAAATGRDVVRPSDPRASSATEMLTLARAGSRRWIVRYTRGDTQTWSSQDVPAGAVRETLAQASQALIRPASGAVAQVTPAPAPPAPPAPAPAATRADWATTGRQLSEPFDGWDPVRESAGGDLMEPFGTPHYAYAEIVDPFAMGALHIDVLDPWAR